MMTTELERNRPKEPVTIRLDADARAALQALALNEGRSVSSLIDLAVREFIERHGQGGGPIQSQPTGLKVRYASLPDTAVLFSFQRLASERFNKIIADTGLPAFEFRERRGDWRALPTDVFSGDADLVESVNWLPIFWHVKRGRTSPRLDYIGPYLQMFVGHCVFVSRDYLTESGALDQDELTRFLDFRAAGTSGRDLSLRSLVAWIAREPERSDRQKLAEKLAGAWGECVVGCQTGTDFHVAIRRIAPILAKLMNGSEGSNQSETDDRSEAARPKEAIVQAIDDLDRGYDDFNGGVFEGFIGNLLQSAELLAQDPPNALLLAGPADLRVPSLNTLAGRKGMFDFEASSGDLGKSVLTLWGEAVRWFRDEVVMSEATDLLKQLLEQIAGSSEHRLETNCDPNRTITILKSLMQSWVKWFESAEEAKSFMGGDGAISGPPSSTTFEDLVSYYQELCELLNPSVAMSAPNDRDPREMALWKFPVLGERTGQASATRLRRVR